MGQPSLYSTDRIQTGKGSRAEPASLERGGAAEGVLPQLVANGFRRLRVAGDID